MAGASLKCKTFKLAFEGEKLTCDLGTDTSVSVDATTAATLANIIVQTATVDNVKTCLAYGAAVSAVCFAGRMILKKCPWIIPFSVKATGELKVAIDSVKNANLQELSDSGEISRTVKMGFEDLGKELKALLGKEVSDQVGKQVMDLIGGFRVDSVQMKGSDLPEDLTAMKVILGSANIKNTNKHNFFATSKDAKGRSIQQLVGPGASVTEENHGGVDMMFVGFGGDDLKAAGDAFRNVVGEDNITVKISVEEGEKTFEGKFKSTQTIDEVIMALKKKEKKFYPLFRDGEELDGEMTLAQAARTGSTVSWKTEQKSKRQKAKELAKKN